MVNNHVINIIMIYSQDKDLFYANDDDNGRETMNI